MDWLWNFIKITAICFIVIIFMNQSFEYIKQNFLKENYSDILNIQTQKYKDIIDDLSKLDSNYHEENEDDNSESELLQFAMEECNK